MSKGHTKGGNFEREICKLLSRWWTGDERDDIFWRSSNSGGRATIRGRKGMKTFGQYGDIQATDPIGQPLIDLCVIEVKRGYSSHTLGDALDCPAKAKPQQWEAFVAQAVEQQKNAESPYWLLITRRNQRVAVVFMPWALYQALLNTTSDICSARPTIRFMSEIDRTAWDMVYGTHLSAFLERVSRDNIVEVLKGIQK